MYQLLDKKTIQWSPGQKKFINMNDVREKFGISSKRITISTSGIPKMIMKLADEDFNFKLALSLHSANQSTREKIMPFTKKFPISDLLESLNYWYTKTNRIITLEYIVWDNINDKLSDINDLINFCKKIPSKVNLIQYNSIGDDYFKGANIEIINKYQSELLKHGINSTFRRSRGLDIDAACGQLVGRVEDRTRRSAKYINAVQLDESEVQSEARH